jgi:hypothetical protein
MHDFPEVSSALVRTTLFSDDSRPKVLPTGCRAVHEGMYVFKGVKNPNLSDI